MAETWDELSDVEKQRIKDSAFEDLSEGQQKIVLRKHLSNARNALIEAQGKGDWAEVAKQAKAIADCEEKLGEEAGGIKTDPVVEQKQDAELAEAYQRMSAERRGRLREENPEKWKAMLDAYEREGYRKLGINI